MAAQIWLNAIRYGTIRYGALPRLGPAIHTQPPIVTPTLPAPVCSQTDVLAPPSVAICTTLPVPVALPALCAPDNDATDLLDPINCMYMTHAIHLLIFIMGIALRAGYEIPYWEIIVVGFFHMAYTMTLVEINRAAVKNDTQAP